LLHLLRVQTAYPGTVTIIACRQLRNVSSYAWRIAGPPHYDILYWLGLVATACPKHVVAALYITLASFCVMVAVGMLFLSTIG
jgi:hypothetical protein